MSLSIVLCYCGEVARVLLFRNKPLTGFPAVFLLTTGSVLSQCISGENSQLIALPLNKASHPGTQWLHCFCYTILFPSCSFAFLPQVLQESPPVFPNMYAFVYCIAEKSF